MDLPYRCECDAKIPAVHCEPKMKAIEVPNKISNNETEYTKRWRLLSRKSA